VLALGPDADAPSPEGTLTIINPNPELDVEAFLITNSQVCSVALLTFGEDEEICEDLLYNLAWVSCLVNARAWRRRD
jgi:hypothetical protein